MIEYPRTIHRTLNTSPSAYEKKLSGVLVAILGRSIHDLRGIVAALNESDVRPSNAERWSEENFPAEMERLGAYPNSTGAPLHSHPAGNVPRGTSAAERPSERNPGGPSDAR